jgi:hypothetical protein
MLLEDLAKVTLASNWRVADILDAEARKLRLRAAAPTSSGTTTTTTTTPAPDQRLLKTELEALRQETVESARQATDNVIAHVSEAERYWQWAIAALSKEPTREDAQPLLRALLGVFESDERLVQASRALWEIATQLGTAPQQLDELNRAEKRFAELAAETRRALGHRDGDWQPADPDRLALGLQLAREGKTVKADEARAWFRRS